LRTVIIGNGGAAMECIAAMRAGVPKYGGVNSGRVHNVGSLNSCGEPDGCGPDGEIHLLSDSLFPAINPTLLTYFIAGKIGLEDIFPFNRDFYDKHDVKLHTGAKVIKLDASGKTVENDAGFAISYDNCVICSGASPGIPGVYQDKDIYTIRSVRDAIALKKQIEKGKKALVAGASMTGLKVVEALVGQGVETSLTDIQPHVFPLAACPECAGMIQRELEKQGVRLYLGTNDHDISGYDIVVVCAGIQPNIEFIDKTQVDTDKAVLVDRYMRTNCDGLYAAGDCAQLRDRGPQPGAVGLWSNARYMGRTAGRNVFGENEAYYETVRHNITRFFGIDFASIGDISQGDDIFETGSSGKYCRIAWKDGRPVGINLLNMPEISGILKSRVQNLEEIPAIMLGRVFSEYPLIRKAFLERGA